MSYSKTKQEESMILSLDAQKAFDRVSWQYLHKSLERFKFGPNFLKWIHILYSNPQVVVKVNGTVSGRFALGRGCPQGCSLSPLVFNISIEPMAQLIRDNRDIKGLIINGEQHKMSIYADDVLLYLADPKLTIPHLKQLIENYGYISGYKVNINKTMAMKIGSNIKLLKIRVDSNGGIKYLGIQIPPSLADLYNVNYTYRKDQKRP